MKLLLTLFILIILIFYNINYFEKFSVQEVPEVPNPTQWKDILDSNKQMPDIFSLKRTIIGGVKDSTSNLDLKKSWMYDISSNLNKTNEYSVKNTDGTTNYDTALNIGYCLSNLYGIPHIDGTYPFPKPKDLNLNGETFDDFSDYVNNKNTTKLEKLKGIFEDDAAMNKIKLCNSFNTYDENYKFSLEDLSANCDEQNMCKKKQDVYSNNEDYCVQKEDSFNIFNSKSSAVISKCNELVRSNWQSISKLYDLFKEVGDPIEKCK